MKNSKQLKEARAVKFTALEAALSEAEGRSLTAEETTLTEGLLSELESMDDEIRHAEKLETVVRQQAAQAAATAGAAPSDGGAQEQTKNAQAYNLGKAIREAGQGCLSGLEKEMHDEARNEFTAAGVSPTGTLQIPISLLEARANTNSTSTNVIGATQHEILEGLVPDSVLERAGANRITGVSGSVLLPSLPTDATAVKAEATTAVAGSAMSGVKIDPVKMASMITITNQALNMSTGAFDAVVARQFRRHSGALIDAEFFKNVIADAATTYSKRKESVSATIGGVTFQNVNGLISKVGDANGLGDNAKFFGSFASMAEARVTEAVANSGVGILQGREIAGYEAFATSLCDAGLLTDADYNTYAEVYAGSAASTAITNAASAQPLFLANMDDTYVCYWGGADLVVDEYTSAHLGVTRLIMNVYANAKTGHQASAAYFATVPV